MKSPLKYVFILMALVLLVSACGNKNEGNDLSPEQVYTQAAETVQAQLTLMAAENTTPTVENPVTDTPEATLTTEVTETPSAPTVTPESQNPTPSSCTYQATFIDDVTYPDGARVSPDEQFVKTWKMMNSGTCTWTMNYSIVLISSDGLVAPETTPLTTGIEVPAGAQISINVQLQAPETEGTYTAYFKLKAPDGTVFGINANGASSFYVKVTVSEAQPTATDKPAATATMTPTTEPTIEFTETPTS